MPIKKVTVKSFKSIVDQTVDLGQLNVFIGTNGSGKSNFLEALGVLSCALDGRIDYSKLAERGIRLSAPEVFKSSFKNLKRKNSFSIDAQFDELSYHANINSNEEANFIFSAEKIEKNGEKIGGRSNAGIALSLPDDVKKLLSKKFNSQMSIVSALEMFKGLTNSEIRTIDSIKGYAIYAPSTPILRGTSSDDSHREPLGLYGGGLSIALADVIQDAHNNQDGGHDLMRFFRLLDWFEEIGTTDEISSKLQSNHLHTGMRVVNYTDKYMKTNFNNLYAYDVSEGALYILFILVLLLHKKSPPIFALDNVDNSLNPGLIRGLMQNIKDILVDFPDKQIFMTTHNPTTLDSIDLFNEKHRLFVVERNTEGHTEIRRILPPPNFTREEWVEKHQGMRLSEIWLSNLIGGLPKGF